MGTLDWGRFRVSSQKSERTYEARLVWNGAARACGLFVLLILVTGCGYRPLTAAVPGGGSDVHISTVENRTPYAGLAAPLTAAIRRHSAAAGLHVAVASSGVPKVTTAILEVQQEPGMMAVQGDHLIPLDTIQFIRVEVRILDANGQLARGPEVLEVRGRAYSGGTVQAEESLAEQRRIGLMDDMGKQIVAYLFL